MRAVVASLNPRSFARTSVWFMVALAAANCSSDSTRLSENPFAGAPPPADMTGSVPRAPNAPAGAVESRPLAAPHASAQPLPPPPAPGRPGLSSGAGYSGGGRGMGSFQPSAETERQAGETTGSLPRLTASPKPKPGWTWEGGTPITVASGDTLASLSQRYGVPADAIAQANGMAGPAALRPGQRLVIPRYNAGAVGATSARPVPAAPVAATSVAAAMSSVHVVAPGETLVGIARRYRRPIGEIAAANNIAPHAMVKMGDRLVIPGKGRLAGRTAAVSAETPSKPAAASPARPLTTPRVAEQTPAPQISPPAESAATVRVVTPPTDALADEEASSRGAAPAFRWPVRGRVIAEFGAKTNGQQNDGINLAVPEGTAIRAAEDGVVAYAGSELKGYGNLVLVRHSNGFVTAYAHASEILVKRNETVRRGQVIAKSGQTGNVPSPQLHFEIRKGARPVDPMPHLASSGA